MSERTPPTGAIRHAFLRCHPFSATTEIEERMAEFDRWLTEIQAEAWDQGKRAGLRQSDWEHGDTATEYVATNPYRKEATGDA